MKPHQLQSLTLCVLLFGFICFFSVTAQENQHCTQVGRWAEGPCYCAEAYNDTAFFTNGGLFEIADFSDAYNPVRLSATLIDGDIRGMRVKGNYAFLANGKAGFTIIDISDVHNPVVLSRTPLDSSDYAYDVEANDSMAYVMGQHYFHIIDIKNLEAPVKLTTVETGWYGSEVTLLDTLVFLSVNSRDLSIYNISDPLNPDEICHLDLDGYLHSVEIKDNTAYLATYNSGLLVFDITNLLAPTEITRLDIGSRIYDITLTDNIMFAAAYDSGMYIYNIASPASPVKTGSMPLTGVTEVFVDHNNAYAIRRDQGFSVIDITTLSSPVEIYHYETAGFAMGIDLEGNYAYIAEEYNGLRILDVSDPSEITRKGFLQIDKVYDVGVNGTYAYLACMEDGIQVIDVSDPEKPILNNTIPVTDYALQIVIEENKAYILFDNNEMRIIDISQPSSPSELGSLLIKGSVKSLCIEGNIAYVAAGDSGIRFIDVSDASQPGEIGFHSIGDYVLGLDVDAGYAYVANWDSGWSIVSLESLDNPVETARIKTEYPVRGIKKQGEYAYLQCDYLFDVYHVTDPFHPVEVAWYNDVNSILYFEVQDNLIYIPNRFTGLSIIRNDLISGLPGTYIDKINFNARSYPNPFYGFTHIEFCLPTASDLTITIYSIDGQMINCLMNNKKRPAGMNSIYWKGDGQDGNRAEAGIYFCVIKTSEGHQTIRLINMRSNL
ncbi:MAG: T9SS type A sorting domain-containing protein [Bacteroidales bacterium]|nr:T9SS type A sorting domain-containing protein [Bacteroidales bacterium]